MLSTPSQLHTPAFPGDKISLHLQPNWVGARGGLMSQFCCRCDKNSVEGSPEGLDPSDRILLQVQQNLGEPPPPHSALLNAISLHLQQNWVDASTHGPRPRSPTPPNDHQPITLTHRHTLNSSSQSPSPFLSQKSAQIFVESEVQSLVFQDVPYMRSPPKFRRTCNKIGMTWFGRK